MRNCSAWLSNRSLVYPTIPWYALIAVFLVAGGWIPCVHAKTAEWELGRSIFEKGIGRDGREIGGRIHGNLTLRGAVVACASCHGADARGGGEAFVQAPDIRWDTLSKTFSPRRAEGTRPAYNRRTFNRALHHGMASSNRSLDPAMPRFDLSQDETEAVVSYLSRFNEVLSSNDVPPKIVLGLLPSSHATKFSQELGDGLNSCPSSESNARFPPLEIIRYADPVDAVSKVNAMITEGRVSYIVAPFIAGWEAQYLNAAKEWSIITLLPVTPLDLPAHPTLAFSLPGLTSQVGALLELAFTSRDDRLTVLTSHRNVPSQDILDFVRAELRVRHVDFDHIIVERPATIRPSSLWLVLAPLSQVERQLHDVKHMPGVTALVPAMFFDPIAARRIGERLPRITWQIAYPYQPMDARTGRWRNPVQVWSEAGCALMASIVKEEAEGWISRQSSITLKTGMILVNDQGDLRRRRQVVVQKWEPPKTTK